MRRLAILALFAAGCSSSSSTNEDPKEDTPKKDDTGAVKKTELESARADLEKKKADLRTIDGDLIRVAGQRKDAETIANADEKTRRISELNTLETNLKKDRETVSQDIATLEGKVKGLEAGGAGANKQTESDADRALREAEDAAKKQEEAELEARKRADSSSTDEEKKKMAEQAKAEEEKRRKMEEEKKGLEGGRAAAKDGPLFEERWADVIIKVRAELQRYKPW